MCASCLEIAGRLEPRRDRDRRGLQPRHQRNARAARERPLPPGARPLQSLHRRRSAPDHQRSVQRAAQDAGRAARVGGVHPVHHRVAQDSDHHRLALPAVQFPLGGFRRAGRAHGVDHASRKASRPTTSRSRVLAQAGEGSVRDSLSALDQAIACCGNKLNAAEVRSLLGMFRSSRWPRVTEALEAGDAQPHARHRGGTRSQRPQPAAFLPRTGALLPQPAGGEDRRRRDTLDRGVAQPSRPACARSRAKFSEEDLTRYLQLTLDTVQGSADLAAAAPASGAGTAAAGACGPAAADRGGAGESRRAPAAGSLAAAEASRHRKGSAPAPSPFQRDAARKAPRSRPPPAALPRRPVAQARSARTALLEARHELHGRRGGALRRRRTGRRSGVRHPQDVQPRHEPERPDEARCRRIGKTARVKITIGEPASAPAAPVAAPPRKRRRRGRRARALADPEVKRFQELFPDAQVRAIRNLKTD